MNSQDYKRLVAEIHNLQSLIRERQSKREPFLSSFADALESVVKKAREWFNEEARLANRQIGILEQVLPNESFAEEKLNLQRYKAQFDPIATKFDKTIKSIREGQFKSLKDFVSDGIFEIVKPEFLGDFGRMFDVCLNLEKLIDELERGAKYITIAQRITEITMETRK
jgi:hypothetical protein